jgi:hypothetical protein
MRGIVMKRKGIRLRSKNLNGRSSATETLVMVLGLVLLCGCGALGAAKAEEKPQTFIRFVDPASIDPKIPPPSSIIGFEVGEKAVRYDPMMHYFEVLAAQ